MIRRRLERARRAIAVVVTAVTVAAGTIACGPVRATSDPSASAEARKPANPTYLVLRVSERRLYMKSRDGHVATESFPIAVGRKGHETPTGQFHVEEMIEWPDYARLDQ